MNDHFSPVGKPAPPRPRRPDFFISSMIQSRPFSSRNLVPSQAPRIFAACEVGRMEAVEIGENAVFVLKHRRSLRQDVLLVVVDGRRPACFRCRRGGSRHRTAAFRRPGSWAKSRHRLAVLRLRWRSPHRTWRSAAPAASPFAPGSADGRLRRIAPHPCGRPALIGASPSFTRLAGVSAASRLDGAAGVGLCGLHLRGDARWPRPASPVSTAFTASSSKRLRHAPIIEPS